MVLFGSWLPGLPFLITKVYVCSVTEIDFHEANMMTRRLMRYQNDSVAVVSFTESGCSDVQHKPLFLVG